MYTPFARLLEPLLTPPGHPLANPLLLAIEAASEPNSYLLLLINALENPQKEPERIRPPLHTPPKPAVIPSKPAILPFKTRLPPQSVLHHPILTIFLSRSINTTYPISSAIYSIKSSTNHLVIHSVSHSASHLV